jgi:hypothetical protein
MLENKRSEKGFEDMVLSFVARLAKGVNIEDCKAIQIYQ